jgi:16S rRNA (cytosine967-C5)-methyltransferase
LPHIETKASRFPDLFPNPIDVTGLSPRDAGLATAIDREVTARWLTLRTIIEPMLSRPWDAQHPAVLASLLSGAAQLLLLDRIPDHAAVSESVQWCRSTQAGRASGVVNAVLRRIARLRLERIERADPDAPDHLVRSDGSGWRLNEPVFGTDVPSRRAAQTGCSPALLARWRTCYGEAEAFQIALRTIAQPPIIVHGAGDHESLIPHDRRGFQIVRPGTSPATIVEAFPEAIVQDPTAAASCAATATLAPEVIVDACAGRGTKTRQLAAMHPGARVIASDTQALRMRDLHELACQHPSIEAVDARDLGQFAGGVDLLVLDVPCTNSGVLARRVEARHRQDGTFRQSLVDTQRQIAADTLALLRPGGTLLWATCSVDPDENQHQVEWLTRWHALEVAKAHAEAGQGGPWAPPASWCDGGFHALLRKPRITDG